LTPAPHLTGINTQGAAAAAAAAKHH